MKIKIIKAKSILNKSKLSGGYTLNPYVGCSHGCAYCYNQEFIQRLRPNQKWGQFLDIKVNAPEILKKEVQKRPKNWVFFSTITDPYNHFEKKYQITRSCLEILLKYQWPISILTKSDLILRDIDLLKKFKEKEIGFTLTSLSPKIAKILESKTSLPAERITALEKIHQAGIPTYAFIGPILPYLTDLSAIFKTLKGKADEIWLDSLNTRGANWQNLKHVLKENWPELAPKYENIFFKNKQAYESKLEQQVRKLSQEFKISIKICF